MHDFGYSQGDAAGPQPLSADCDPTSEKGFGEAVAPLSGHMVSARGAIDPRRGAAQVVLLLPDRNARLGLVDDVPACIEGCAAMFGGDAAPPRQLPQLQVADAVHTHGAAFDACRYIIDEAKAR